MNKEFKIKKLKKGDTVEVLLGKDRGKQGVVESIKGKDKKIIITGVNLFKRHVKKQGQIEGGIIEIAKPVNLSNIALVCPKCKKLTRVGFKFTDSGKVRICKKCQGEI